MGMKVFRQTWWALVATVVFSIAKTATAIYLDDGQTISLRTRIYTQAAIRTEGSYDGTTPSVKAGQLVQHRNFFNPELEAKLASYTTWMRDQGGLLRVIAPESFDFRLAAWGFYDGIYDYGTQQFDQQRHKTRTIFTQATSLEDVLRGEDERENPREIYGSQRRVNELYLSYAKGPLFVRFGRQAISWGESDTIAILDQNNPFDLTLGIPGVLEDLDEARIPLWTLRTSYALFDTLGPFSSAFVEAYWVPGDIDNTTAIVPLSTLSPYSPPGPDPASNPSLGFIIGNGSFALVDHIPSHSMGNSRWGVRTQTVVARDYTVSAWIYTAFPNAPVPRMAGLAYAKRGAPPTFMVETVHQLVPVIGLSNSFFFEPLNGILRMEAEYFNREPAFIPDKNMLTGLSYPDLLNRITKCTDPKTGRLVPCSRVPGALPQGGTVPHADFIRWELGYDRFFFFRPFNPTNSFTWVTAFVGSWNLDETSRKDFRQVGQQRPGTFDHTQPTAADFVQLPKVDMFVQSHLSTDYMHGRLTPNITGIFNAIGTYVIAAQLTYRWSDSLIFDTYYTTIGGAFGTGPGFFRDRDQVAFRATYQLN
jgi:hypothetical protein